MLNEKNYVISILILLLCELEGDASSLNFPGHWKSSNDISNYLQNLANSLFKQQSMQDDDISCQQLAFPVGNCTNQPCQFIYDVPVVVSATFITKLNTTGFLPLALYIPTTSTGEEDWLYFKTDAFHQNFIAGETYTLSTNLSFPTTTPSSGRLELYLFNEQNLSICVFQGMLIKIADP